METKVWNVEGMTCMHCVKAIQTSVGALNGIEKVEVSLPNKNVSITLNPDLVKDSEIISVIEEEGYKVL